MKLQHVNLKVYEKKTLSHILLYIFCLHLLGTHHDYVFKTSSKEALKLCKHSWKWHEIVLLVSYFFNYISSRLTLYGIWRCLEYGFCQINKLKLFASCRKYIFLQNNLSDEEMLLSHLMRCMNYMNGSLFHDKNEIKLSERKKTATEENYLKAINMLSLKTLWS